MLELCDSGISMESSASSRDMIGMRSWDGSLCSLPISPWRRFLVAWLQFSENWKKYLSGVGVSVRMFGLSSLLMTVTRCLKY